jgi:hypothetical protein
MTTDRHTTSEALAQSGGEALSSRLRALAQRPARLTVRDTIDRN